MAATNFANCSCNKWGRTPGGVNSYGIRTRTVSYDGSLTTLNKLLIDANVCEKLCVNSSLL